MIHDTAIIHENAKIGSNVSIGPYSIIGENVTLHDDVKIDSHVVIDGATTIGENTEIFPFCSIGKAPQDLKYAGEATKLIIGKNNKIREYVTINTGTMQDKGTTIIGDNNLIMIAAHVAHDCVIGDNTILANNVTLAGHVKIDDYAIIGGLSAIQQFVRIGKHAMIGGMSGVENDVIPYGTVQGERAFLSGLNLIGLKRRDFDKNSINNLRNAFKILFEDETKNFQERVKQLSNNDALVDDVINFINEKRDRAICMPK